MKYGEHIVTGLSGGPDSVCLFHVLLSLQEELDLKLYPVHINHKFRPGAAERDQDYVENLCAEHGIRCTTVVRDCGKLAAELGMTDEEAWPQSTVRRLPQCGGGDRRRTGRRVAGIP